MVTIISLSPGECTFVLRWDKIIPLFTRYCNAKLGRQRCSALPIWPLLQHSSRSQGEIPKLQQILKDKRKNASYLIGSMVYWYQSNQRNKTF